MPGPRVAGGVGRLVCGRAGGAAAERPRASAGTSRAAAMGLRCVIASLFRWWLVSTPRSVVAIQHLILGEKFYHLSKFEQFDPLAGDVAWLPFAGLLPRGR